MKHLKICLILLRFFYAVVHSSRLFEIVKRKNENKNENGTESNPIFARINQS